MKTIIAEKPSVAREIARIVGATKREEGYFEGGGYAVTWAFGHLVQLAMPDGYGVRGFVRDNLPIIPDTFTLVPRQVRTEKGYKPDSGVVSQIKVIKRLFDTSEHIIVATDAGREGELIFRYLYHYTGCTTPSGKMRRHCLLLFLRLPKMCAKPAICSACLRVNCPKLPRLPEKKLKE